MLFSVLIILGVAFSNIPSSDKIPLIMFAPVFAVVYWYQFLFLLLICRYLGVFGRILAHVLVVYFFLFSRLIVQQPPRIELPLT
jgi:hypothetical protein